MEQTRERQDKKTILVVDDDPAILNTISGFLDNEYTVLRANSPLEAIQKSKEFPSEIDLLLSDFQMPGMTGMELRLS